MIVKVILIDARLANSAAKSATFSCESKKFANVLRKRRLPHLHYAPVGRHGCPKVLSTESGLCGAVLAMRLRFNFVLRYSLFKLSTGLTNVARIVCEPMVITPNRMRTRTPIAIDARSRVVW
jgi:hypothetical protein